MNAFFDNPEQWELWKSERPETMVDEVDPLGDAGDVVPAHRTGGRRDRRRSRSRPDSASGCSTPARTTTRTSSRTRTASTSPASPTRTSASGARRALLHRRQPRPDGDQADLRRDRRHLPDITARRPEAAALRLDQRHQGAAGPADGEVPRPALTSRDRTHFRESVRPTPRSRVAEGGQLRLDG